MTIRRVSRALIASVAAFMVCTVSAQGQAPIEWQYYTFNQPNDNITKTNRAFAEDVFKATNGRLKISVSAAGELPYRAQEVLRAVANNQIQMGDIAVGLAAGDVPELDVMSLPFLCASYEQFERALPMVSKAADEVLNRKFGLAALMHWTPPPQNLWSSRTISTLNDFKGLKVRTWNPPQVEMMRALGGTAVTISPAEVIPALQRKVIDAIVTGSLSANDWRAYDVVSNGYLLNISMGHMAIVVNNAELAKLPPDLQQVLRAKATEWRPKYMQMSREGGRAALANMASKGVKLVDPTPDDLQKGSTMVRSIWDDWAKKHGDIGRSMLDGTRAACQGG